MPSCWEQTSETDDMETIGKFHDKMSKEQCGTSTAKRKRKSHNAMILQREQHKLSSMQYSRAIQHVILAPHNTIRVTNNKRSIDLLFLGAEGIYVINVSYGAYIQTKLGADNIDIKTSSPSSLSQQQQHQETLLINMNDLFESVNTYHTTAAVNSNCVYLEPDIKYLIDERILRNRHAVYIYNLHIPANVGHGDSNMPSVTRVIKESVLLINNENETGDHDDNEFGRERVIRKPTIQFIPATRTMENERSENDTGIKNRYRGILKNSAQQQQQQRDENVSDDEGEQVQDEIVHKNHIMTCWMKNMGCLCAWIMISSAMCFGVVFFTYAKWWW